MLDFNIRYYILAIILIYIPFHLFEEAMGNFPKWMKEHKWIPENITYGHWMANNIFFYFPLLLIAFLVYYYDENKFMFIGVGILFWGIINCFDHLVYTIIEQRISPGIFTGFIFGAVSIIGLTKLYLNGELTLILFILSVISGFVYAFLPIVESILFHKKFRKIFI